MHTSLHCGPWTDQHELTFNFNTEVRDEENDSVSHDHTYQTTYLFQCPTCCKRYKTATASERHKRSHITRGKGKFRCRKCRKKFHTKTALHCHRIVNHNVQSRYCCKLCNMFWICDSMYTQHMKTHSGLKRLLNCHHCERVFKNAGKFAVHQALHFESKPRYRCNICSKEFSHRGVSLGHNCQRVRQKPLDEARLPRLVEVAVPVLKLERIESYSAPEQSHCPGCGKNMATWAKLRVKKHLSACSREHECTLCEQRFRTLGSLVKHTKYSTTCGRMDGVVSWRLEGLVSGQVQGAVSGRVEGEKRMMKKKPYFNRKHKNTEKPLLDSNTSMEKEENLPTGERTRAKLRKNKGLIIGTNKYKYTEMPGYKKRKVWILPCERCGHVSNTHWRHARHSEQCESRRKPSRKLLKARKPWARPEPHSQTEPRSQTTIECKCTRVFPSIQALIEHTKASEPCGAVNSAGESGGLVCERCGQVSDNKWRHARHKERCASHHMCGKCKKKFIQESKYRAHVESNCETNIECVKCNKGFNNLKALIEHTKHSASCGEVTKNYECEVCTRKFLTEKGYLKHQGSVNCKAFPCPVCKKVFTAARMVDVHMVTHTKERNYRCTKCDRTFLQQGHLYQHYRANAVCGEGADVPEIRPAPGTGNQAGKKEVKTFICDVCGKNFPTKLDFKYHMYIHSGDCVCKSCGKEFADWKGMRKHQKTVCMGDKVCDVCGKKSFSNRMDFFRHMQEHDPLVKFERVMSKCRADFQCHRCGLACTRPAYLKNHILHSCAQGFMCEQCGQTDFRSKMEYRKHMYGHDSEYCIELEVMDGYPHHTLKKEHLCYICFKSFNTVASKLKHPCMKSEEAKIEGQFQCEMCDVVKTTRDGIRHHRNRVHGPKIPCEFCGKQFIATTLVLHKRTHTGEIPYKCKQCGRGFKTSSHLKYHNTRQGCA